MGEDLDPGPGAIVWQPAQLGNAEPGCHGHIAVPITEAWGGKSSAAQDGMPESLHPSNQVRLSRSGLTSHGFALFGGGPGLGRPRDPNAENRDLGLSGVQSLAPHE